MSEVVKYSYSQPLLSLSYSSSFARWRLDRMRTCAVFHTIDCMHSRLQIFWPTGLCQVCVWVVVLNLVHFDKLCFQSASEASDSFGKRFTCVNDMFLKRAARNH